MVVNLSCETKHMFQVQQWAGVATDLVLLHSEPGYKYFNIYKLRKRHLRLPALQHGVGNTDHRE